MTGGGRGGEGRGGRGGEVRGCRLEMHQRLMLARER